jgi:hypothetical protein
MNISWDQISWLTTIFTKKSANAISYFQINLESETNRNLQPIQDGKCFQICIFICYVRNKISANKIPCFRVGAWAMLLVAVLCKKIVVSCRKSCLEKLHQAFTFQLQTATLATILRLKYCWGYGTPWIGNFTERKSRVVNEIPCMTKPSDHLP